MTRAVTYAMAATLCLLSAVGGAEQRAVAWPESVEREALRRVRSTPAKVLQPGEGDLALQQWLMQELGRSAKVDWSVAGCDLKPPLPDPDGGPVCVLAWAEAAGPVLLKLHIRVGTVKAGVTGQLAVFDTSFLSCGAGAEMDFRPVGKLSDVRTGLRELSGRPGCDRRR
jgi:hypothetical protein